MIAPVQVRLAGTPGMLPRWKPAPMKLGQTANQVKTAAASFMMVPAAIAGLTSYVGFRLGSQDHGIPSLLGYTVGVLGALGAIGSLLLSAGIMRIPIPTLPSAEPKPGPLV